MRIAFLADPLDRQYGGIHVYTKELLNELSRVDSKNEYIVIRSEAKNEFDGMREIVIPYSSFPGYRFWRLFFQIPKILSKHGIDIVVEPAHFGPFNLSKNIKRVTVIHDMTVFLFPKYHVFLSQYLQRKFLPRIISKSDQIITNSVSTTNDLIKRFPFAKNKTNSILLGKNGAFKPKSDIGILLRHKINQPYILFVGTLEPRKNLLTLIESFNIFKTQTGLKHQLVLIGKNGWKSAEIIEAIEQSSYNSDIMILGYVSREELPVFYSMAEIFVYPSIYEGFGLPVLEAMACGTPVITSCVSSLPEIGGSAVLYTDPHSVDQLTAHMVRLCSNSEERQKYGRLGLGQSAKFSWEKTARKTVDLFETMI